MRGPECLRQNLLVRVKRNAPVSRQGADPKHLKLLAEVMGAEPKSDLAKEAEPRLQCAIHLHVQLKVDRDGAATATHGLRPFGTCCIRDAVVKTAFASNGGPT